MQYSNNITYCYHNWESHQCVPGTLLDTLQRLRGEWLPQSNTAVKWLSQVWNPNRFNSKTPPLCHRYFHPSDHCDWQLRSLSNFKGLSLLCDHSNIIWLQWSLLLKNKQEVFPLLPISSVSPHLQSNHTGGVRHAPHLFLFIFDPWASCVFSKANHLEGTENISCSG